MREGHEAGEVGLMSLGTDFLPSFPGLWEVSERFLNRDVKPEDLHFKKKKNHFSFSVKSGFRGCWLKDIRSCRREMMAWCGLVGMKMERETWKVQEKNFK